MKPCCCQGHIMGEARVPRTLQEARLRHKQARAETNGPTPGDREDLRILLGECGPQEVLVMHQHPAMCTVVVTPLAAELWKSGGRAAASEAAVPCHTSCMRPPLFQTPRITPPRKGCTQLNPPSLQLMVHQIGMLIKLASRHPREGRKTGISYRKETIKRGRLGTKVPQE